MKIISRISDALLYGVASEETRAQIRERRIKTQMPPEDLAVLEDETAADSDENKLSQYQGGSIVCLLVYTGIDEATGEEVWQLLSDFIAEEGLSMFYCLPECIKPAYIEMPTGEFQFFPDGQMQDLVDTYVIHSIQQDPDFRCCLRSLEVDPEDVAAVLQAYHDETIFNWYSQQLEEESAESDPEQPETEPDPEQPETESDPEQPETEPEPAPEPAPAVTPAPSSGYNFDLDD